MEHYERHINAIEKILGRPLAESERRMIGLQLGIVATEAAIEQLMKMSAQIDARAKLDVVSQEQQDRAANRIMAEILKPL